MQSCPLVFQPPQSLFLIGLLSHTGGTWTGCRKTASFINGSKRPSSSMRFPPSVHFTWLICLLPEIFIRTNTWHRSTFSSFPIQWLVLFACMGLISHRLIQYGIDGSQLKRIYFLFVIACLPAYFLSALWLPIPRWVYVIVVLAIIFQLIGWFLMVRIVRKAMPVIKRDINGLAMALFCLCAVALTIKLILQAASVIPSFKPTCLWFSPDCNWISASRFARGHYHIPYCI